MSTPNIETLADTIVWAAKEIQASETPCQNLNSAIHSIYVELGLAVIERMEQK